LTPATLPRLHVVTDDVVLQRSSFHSDASAILSALGDRVALHVRARTASAATLFDHTEKLLRTARASGATLVVNDRVDIALVTGSNAVQITRRSLPVAAARMLLGDQALIGFSTHPAEPIEEEVLRGANFLLAGSIYETTSHPGVRGAGPEFVQKLQAQHGIPVVAIGGVTVDRADEIVRAGAYGAAVITAVWNAGDPVQAARKLARILYNDDTD
jgi:thiamine-phosphate diphosphorylase